MLAVEGGACVRLWAAVVAERLGFNRDTALTFAMH